MSLITILIIALVVPALLSWLSGKSNAINTDSTQQFDMRPGRAISVIGIIGAAFFLFCIIGASIAGALEGYLIAIFGGLFLLGIFVILLPVKGFWEVTVNGDKVTSSRFWIFRKTIDIHDMEKNNKYFDTTHVLHGP